MVSSLRPALFAAVTNTIVQRMHRGVLLRNSTTTTRAQGGRRRLATLAAATLLVAAFAPVWSSDAAAADQPVFVQGSGYASADSIGFGIKYGGSPIGFTVGRSIAGYRNSTGTSEARAIDLGAFPQLFGPLPTCEKPPLLPASSLPPVTAANSFDPASSQSRRTEAFFPGLGGEPSTVSAGFQDATATATPSSRAITETPMQNAGIFTLMGAHTEVSTQLVGQTRSAHAVMAADTLDLLNGLMVFVHPKWEATATSGATTNNTGSFSYDWAYVRGVIKLPAQADADLAWFSDWLAQTFYGLGVHLDTPKVVIEGNRVRVTPLALRLTDPPLGAEAIKPLLAALLPDRQGTFDQLIAQDCSNATPLQLFDVIFQVLSGAGSILMPVGGVEASTDDTYYPPADSFAATLLPPEPSTVVAPPVTSPPMITPAPIRRLASAVIAAPSPSPGVVEGITETAPTTVVPTAAAPKRIDVPLPIASIPTRYSSGHRGGTAAVVGGLALLGVVILVLADRAAIRRSARKIPA